MACARGPAGNAPAELVPSGFAVMAASGASGDSLTAGHVSATGMQTSVTPARELAWAAAITQGVSTVKGEPGAAGRGWVGGKAAPGAHLSSCCSPKVRCWLPWGPTAPIWGPVPALSLP